MQFDTRPASRALPPAADLHRPVARTVLVTLRYKAKLQPRFAGKQCDASWCGRGLRPLPRLRRDELDTRGPRRPLCARCRHSRERGNPAAFEQRHWIPGSASRPRN